MKNLTLAEFKDTIDTILKDIVLNDDIYQITEKALGGFVVMSKEEYDIHHEAVKILLCCADLEKQ